MDSSIKNEHLVKTCPDKSNMHILKTNKLDDVVAAESDGSKDVVDGWAPKWKELIY